MFERHAGICLQEIPGKGRGIVATQAIAEGSTIEVCPVLPLSWEDSRRISRTRLADYDFAWPVKEGHPDNVTAITFGWGSMYNHSDASNTDWECQPATKTIHFYTTRDIAAGEELLIDYGWDHENFL